MINQEIIEYNYRQINLMKNRIKLYQDNKIETKQFIDDIDALMAWIKKPPSDWIKALKSLLWEIEIPYATALAHGEDLTAKEIQQISRSVDKIKELVLWYEQNCLPPIDGENL